jgi:hypothetical protein
MSNRSHGDLGTVIRTVQPKLLEYVRYMQCTKCKYTFAVYASVEERNSFPKVLSFCLFEFQRGDVCRSNFVRIKTWTVQEGRVLCRLRTRPSAATIRKLKSRCESHHSLSCSFCILPSITSNQLHASSCTCDSSFFRRRYTT